MKKQKIFFLCEKFPPSIGGLQKSNYEIAKVLNEIETNTEVFVFNNKEKNYKKFDKKQKFNIERLSHKSKKEYPPLYKRFISFSKDYLILRKKVSQKNPDKIIVAGKHLRKVAGIFPFFKNIEIIDITSVPQIDLVRNNRFITKLRNVFERKYYKKVDKQLFVSKSTKKKLYRYYRKDTFRNKPKLILYRSIDEKFINKPKDEKKIKKMKKKFRIDRNKIIILTVSRIEKEKGIDHVLDTIYRLKNEENKNFRYLIVGGGSYLKNLKRKVKKLNLKKQVTFVGEVKHEDIIDYYDLGDIFILPSRRGPSESFGRVFAEASARKNAVIGNKSGGVVEVIDDGKTGFLVDPYNKEEIYNKLSKLLKNDDLRLSLGKKGRKKVKETFTKKQLKEGLKRVL